MVGGGLAAVADELEAADDLADGEEADKLREDDAAGGELGGADAADAVEDGLRGLEEAAGAEGVPRVLVEGLEGGDGAVVVSVLVEGTPSRKAEPGGWLTEGSSSGPGR